DPRAQDWRCVAQLPGARVARVQQGAAPRDRVLARPPAAPAPAHRQWNERDALRTLAHRPLVIEVESPEERAAEQAFEPPPGSLLAETFFLHDRVQEDAHQPAIPERQLRVGQL